MADTLFARWPEQPAVAAAIGHVLYGSPLVSMIEPAEVALFAADGTVDDLPEGGARYMLDLASDTGAVDEPFGAIMLVAFDVPEDRVAEVDRWYDEEHIELLMRAPGWLRARRYIVRDWRGGPRWTSMAFHELRDRSVMDSPERAFARSTPWRAELEKEDWFGGAGRGLFAPLAR